MAMTPTPNRGAPPTNSVLKRITTNQSKFTMKNFDIKSAVVGALLAVVITLSVSAAIGSRSAWEYKVVPGHGFHDELTEAINSSVAEGWEFVSASGPNAENWGLAVLRREKK